MLPPGDGTGGYLVANEYFIARLNQQGRIIQTYDVKNDADYPQANEVANGTYSTSAGDPNYSAPGDVNGWFAMVIAPDGKTLWAGSRYDLFHFDIASGKQIGPKIHVSDTVLHSGQEFSGLCVMNEYKAANIDEICGDGIDNDGDGFIDNGCTASKICQTTVDGNGTHYSSVSSAVPAIVQVLDDPDCNPDFGSTVPVRLKAENNYYFTSQGVTLNVPVNGILGNDDAEFGPLTVVLPAGDDVLHGTVTQHANGSLTYVPEPGFVGTVNYPYRALDANGNRSNVAVVYITVTAPLNAVDDSGTPVNGLIGGQSFGNVLVNDTQGNALVVPSDVTTTFVSSTNAGVTLSGTNVLVASGTAAGNWALVYQICEVRNPASCDTATVTVPVTAAPIDAVDNAGAPVNSLTGGTSFANVLGNDTLNFLSVDPLQVTTTFVSSTHPGVTLSGTDVVVAAGTPGGGYTLIYKICEILNPTNCDTATVTVPVTAVIDAVDDAGASVVGFAGGTSFTNVLTNDLLNGVAVNPALVTVSQISTSNAGVTLSGTNVVVAPGTSAGNYALVYRICEIANLSNCDQATVTVPVTAAVIDAIDDAGVSVNGSVGGTSFVNVLANDLLHGAPLNPAKVTTTFVSSTNAGVTLSGTDVKVAAGTPAGNYTLDYKICEKQHPTNCDTATVTVPVRVATISADDDNGTPVSGAVGGTSFTNVLVNDTWNGGPVNPAKVTTTFVSSSHAGVTLSGTNVVVAAGTPAGTQTLVYQICEILNPTNCDTATVTVPVTAPVIDAINDAGVAVNGFTGGTSFTNVLVNDTLNGAAAVPATVTTTFVSSTNTGVSLSGTNVIVAAGTPAGNYSLLYQICENLNPTNCDAATVTVTVTKPVIDAINDAGASVNGFTGGTSFTNVLVNDTLNTVAVVPASVTTTFVSSTHAGVTLSGTNVMVAAGTPAGSYSLVYTICEILNPTNCDQATVTAPVTATAIDAINDTGAPVVGAVGGTSIATVLTNDTLNAVALNPASVTTTFVSSTHAGVTLSGTSVVVAAGTPTGTYSLVYKICENLNPTNCDTATVTVPVAAIDAVNDTGAPVVGTVGGTSVANVLVNDTLNGAAVDPAKVITTFVSSSNAGVTLSGTTVSVAAGTPGGTYTLVYKICEILIPTNCDQATVTIPVAAGAIDAVNDTGVSVNGFVGGTSVTNVLANDTLSSAPVDAAKVTTTFVSSTHAGVTLSGTDVVVAAGTPAGSYTLVYQICEKLNPTTCDTATVTLPVAPAVIDAVADAGVSVNGSVGGTSFVNVLTNDTLNGAAVDPAKVTTTFVSSSHANVTLSGTDVVVAAGTPAGTYTLVYKICEKVNPTNCDTATVTVPVRMAAIAADDDSGAAVNGASGGTSYTNVLVNDTLNGGRVNPAAVTATFVSSTNAGVTLSGTNVMVAAGTPSGSYSLVYQICENLNPTNCDTATVSVPVNAGAIDAVNDAGAAVNSAVGGTSLTNVLSNDTLNGAPVVASKVVLTTVASTNPGVTLSGANVVVAAGTPAGNYTLTYQICEILNPTNCDTATVTVTVTPVIDAVNDTGASVNGFAGGTSLTNVLANDTLNGVAVDPTTVTVSQVSTSNAGVTLSATNVVVAAGTAAGDYTLVYKICETLNPTNCDTATVSVTVTAAVIDAVNDTGASVNGFVGGTSFTNVLANDTLNGVAVDPTKVTVSQVSTSNAGVTLSGANVVVAAGTPAGTYSLVYKICEILNPTSCDTATVSVTVTAAVIDARDDAGVSVAGASGGTSFTNVLANDLLNGVAVDPAKVTTTLVSSTNAGVTLAGTNVVVAAGTPGGNYTLIYRICEILNPDNCDSASVTVPVTVIDAVNDTGASVNGFVGGTSFTNVLANDTLNGVAVDPTKVTVSQVSTSNAGVTLAGTNVVVAAGTPAGSYSLVYKICEILNPTNCDTATVSVTVTAAVIDAVNDTGASVNGFAGGTSLTNVLANDTLNGVAVVPAKVATTFVSSTNTGVTLSGTNVVVAAGTPAGSYTLVYQICEILNPTNCDTATVSVTVTAAVIDAINDTGAAVNGIAGGTSFTNVLANDTLNGVAVVPAKVATTLVSSTNPGVTLSGTNVVVAPGTAAGTYSLVYKICEILNPTNCDTATVSVPVTAVVCEPGPSTTYTQGGWGAKPSGSNPGALLQSKFLLVYPTATVQIGGGRTLRFTSSAAITAFLPQGGSPGVLATSAVNPTSSAAGVFAGQVLALQLNVDFSTARVTKFGLAGKILASGKLAGYTVGQVLSLANGVLGGAALPAGVSVSDLNGIVDAINQNFDNGTTDKGYLLLEAGCTPANRPPVAVNDGYATLKNTRLNVASPGIKVNDSDPDGNAISAELVTTTTHGTLSLNADGSFSYMPGSNYVGADSFTYRVKDASGLNSNVATVTITITAVVCTLNANDDGYTTNKNHVLTILATGVLANDSDPYDRGLAVSQVNGSAAKVGVVVATAHGSVKVGSDGGFTYTPAVDYLGADTFTYTAKSLFSTSASDMATVTITIAAHYDGDGCDHDRRRNGHVDGDGCAHDKALDHHYSGDGCDHDRKVKGHHDGDGCSHDRDRRRHFTGDNCDHDRRINGHTTGDRCAHELGSRTHFDGDACDHDRDKKGHKDGDECDHDKQTAHHNDGDRCDHELHANGHFDGDECEHDRDGHSHGAGDGCDHDRKAKGHYDGDHCEHDQHRGDLDDDENACVANDAEHHHYGDGDDHHSGDNDDRDGGHHSGDYCDHDRSRNGHREGDGCDHDRIVKHYDGDRCDHDRRVNGHKEGDRCDHDRASRDDEHDRDGERNSEPLIAAEPSIIEDRRV